MLFYFCYFSSKVAQTKSRKKPTSSTGKSHSTVTKEDTSKKLG